MILTGADLAKRRGGPEPAADLPGPDLPEPAVPAPAAGPRVRMHHPDDPDHVMRCEFELGGERVRVEGGVAVVGAELAGRLEAAGWLRGREAD